MIRPADLPDGRLEEELRAAFTGATDDLAPTRDPWARTQRAVARSRARRRAGALATVAVAAVAVVGTVLPLRTATPDPPTRDPRPTVTSADTDITTWPTRGDLADRADLLGQVRATAAAPGESVLSVPFLGEVDGFGFALLLVWGPDGDGKVGRRLVARAGPLSQAASSWDAGEVPFPYDLSGSFPVPVLSAALRARDGTVRLVVVTVPDGVSVAVSQRPQIDAQGIVTRRYTAVPLQDGVGTTTFRGPPSATTLRLQRGDASPVIRDLALVGSRGDFSGDPLAEHVATSCQSPPFEHLRLNLQNAGRDAAAGAGRAADEITEVRAVGCRQVGNHAVMFAAVRLEDGTALQAVMESVGNPDAPAYIDPKVHPVPRSRATTFPRFHRLSWVEGSPDSVVGDVLIYAPGGATAELVWESGDHRRVIATARLGADGVGIGSSSTSLAVALEAGDRPPLIVVRDGAGRELETVTVPGDDPLGRQLDGPVEGA